MSAAQSSYAAGQSAFTGGFSGNGGGNSHGHSMSFGAPIYTSPSGNFGVGAAVGRQGAWNHNQGANYSAGVGFSWKF